MPAAGEDGRCTDDPDKDMVGHVPTGCRRGHSGSRCGACQEPAALFLRKVTEAPARLLARPGSGRGIVHHPFPLPARDGQHMLEHRQIAVRRGGTACELVQSFTDICRRELD